MHGLLIEKPCVSALKFTPSQQWVITRHYNDPVGLQKKSKIRYRWAGIPRSSRS